MQIQKISMNWLPRASAWQEMESARIKRKTHNEDFLATSQSFNSTIISSNVTSGDQVQLAMQVAMDRLKKAQLAKAAAAAKAV